MLQQQEQQRLVLAKLVSPSNYHTSSEYRELTMEQKKDLSEWHASNPDKKKKCNKTNKEKDPSKKQQSSVVAKEVQKALATTVNAQPGSSHDSNSMMMMSTLRSTSQLLYMQQWRRWRQKLQRRSPNPR